MTPLFIATRRFDTSDGQRWIDYFNWARIPALVEVVSLDSLLRRDLITTFNDEDWKHNVQADFRLNYFYDLGYLLGRVSGESRRNILSLYRNPDTHIDVPPASGGFGFMGYDLIEEATQISALTNCGGFPNTFSNDELNKCGLIPEFVRANEIQKLLPERNPDEPHARCELYAIWRLAEK